MCKDHKEKDKKDEKQDQIEILRSEKEGLGTIAEGYRGEAAGQENASAPGKDKGKEKCTDT